HRRAAQAWWDASEAPIAFTRFTQVGVLRLLTTAAVMDGKPLNMLEAWSVHDRLYEDHPGMVVAEPNWVEAAFREYTTGGAASPKVWADAWLLAFARLAEGTVVTFDRALTARGARCLLMEADRH